MRVTGTLIIWGSLALGVVSVVTAYTPSLRLADELLTGLHLAAPAGVKVDGAGRPLRDARGRLLPLAGPGARLTPALLAELRAAGAHFVTVKQFDWRRWPGRWWFVLGCAGLIGGATLVKRGARRQVTAQGESAMEGPRTAVEAMQREVAALRAAWMKLGPRERLQSALERLGAVQRDHIPALVAARDSLIARSGLGAYAQLMAVFAAAERQLNRAWSAAADGVEGEVHDCLRRADELLAVTREQLGQ